LRLLPLQPTSRGFLQGKMGITGTGGSRDLEFSLLFSQGMKVTPLDLLVEECQPVSFPE
jgi:hypothetical protein